MDEDKKKAESEKQLRAIESQLKKATQEASALGRLGDFAIKDYLAAAKNANSTSHKDLISSLYRISASKDNFQEEISSLRKKISEATLELDSARQQGNKFEVKVSELEALVKELRVKEDLGFLLTRVSSAAQEKLINDVEFRSIFSEDKDCNAFVMSVDIRRSTELMLKARTPALFAEFISRVNRELYACVVSNSGVFDKFTGDGILAFFPEQFSGEDYGYLVVKAADECHKVFESIYRDSRSSFTSVLNGVGLGIGIDFGTVRLLRVAEGLTVVGIPVVYACRMSGALPGQTLLNQPAYELIYDRYGSKLHIAETSINIKHEGDVLAYSVALKHEKLSPRPAGWESTSGE